MKRRTWWIGALLALTVLGGCKGLLTEDEYWPEAAKAGKAFQVNYYLFDYNYDGQYSLAQGVIYSLSDVATAYSCSHSYSSNTGYRSFHYWSTVPGGGGATYYPGDLLPVTGGVLQLYAVYQ